MHPFLDYILKANLLLIFFGLFYLIFLKRETFYQLNRWYFIGSIIVSITAPLVTFTKTVLVDPIPVEYFTTDNEVLVINEIIEEPSFLETIDLQQTAAYLILFISSLLIIRKLYAVAKLYRSIKKLPSLDNSNIKITADNKTVYSFYQWIVVPENFFQWQNHQLILEHESIHLNQKHTFDLILIEIVAAVFWFNPLVKVMQRAINTNLEFIVDQKMIETTESVLYQKNLLQFQTQHAIQFVNSYNASEIKNRILQLNSKKSTNMKKLKLVITLPVLVAFFTLFQVETIAQVKETLELEEIEETSFLVRENFTKQDFAKLSEELKANFDIDFSVRNIKYKNDKINSLDYTIRNKDYKISASETGNDKNIDPFLIIVNLNDHEPFRVEKYSAKPTYSYTVDNEVEPNFSITEDEWKDGNWVKKISNDQKVIYIIDGSRSSKGAALTLNPKDILSINIHRDQETKDKFNEAVDNIVIIKTKKVTDDKTLSFTTETLQTDRKVFDEVATKFPIVVDGELMSKEDLKKFDNTTIKSMNINIDHTGKKAITKLNISTKKFTSDKTYYTFKKATDTNKKDDKNKRTSFTTISINEDNIEVDYPDNVIETDNGMIVTEEGNIVAHNPTRVHLQGNASKNILYIVDGKEINGEDFRKIHPNNIERIDVLKDKKAIEKYGDKAKDGVLLITTKAKKEVSLQQKTQALKERELAMKQRNEVAERKDIILQNRKEREKSRQQLLKKRNEISEKAQERRKELEEQQWISDFTNAYNSI